MTTMPATDERLLEPLLRELRATRADGLPPMTAVDRAALRAARTLIGWSRHHRAAASRAAELDSMRDALAATHPFEHRLDAGPTR